MLFSIVIPVYNVEKYLSECLDSILNQTFHDYEVILVDDGSKDRSYDIAKEYAVRDHRIKLIHKDNGGQSTARNVGTKNASGEYIIYIDSDDYITSIHFFEDIAQKLLDSSYNIDIIFYKHQKFYDSKHEYEKCLYSFSSIKECDTYFSVLEKMVIEDSFFGMPWNKCIKKSVIIENDIFFEEGLTGEDMDWIYKILLNSNTILTIDKPFIAYRQRENSITSSLKIKNLIDYVKILEKWSDFFLNGNFSEIEKNIYLGSLAKYYSNLLITYNRVQDENKINYYARIKKLSILLNYSMSKRPCIVNVFNCIFGLKITLMLLKLIDKQKG